MISSDSGDPENPEQWWGSDKLLAMTTLHAPYLNAQFDEKTIRRLNGTQIHELHNREGLVKSIKEIVQIEGPIRNDQLAMKIAWHFGSQRTGEKIQRLVKEIADDFLGLPSSQEGEYKFYWPDGIELGSDIPFRRPLKVTDRRAIDMICVQELRSLAKITKACFKHKHNVNMANLAGFHSIKSDAFKKRFKKALEAA